jgi:hypothetical protein
MFQGYILRIARISRIWAADTFTAPVGVRIEGIAEYYPKTPKHQDPGKKQQKSHLGEGGDMRAIASTESVAFRTTNRWLQ